MSLPEEWSYESYPTKAFGPFKYCYIKLPIAWFVEGTNSFQMLCPYCDYGKGFNQPVIAMTDIKRKKKLFTCDTCQTQFIGLNM